MRNFKDVAKQWLLSVLIVGVSYIVCVLITQLNFEIGHFIAILVGATMGSIITIISKTLRLK